MGSSPLQVGAPVCACATRSRLSNGHSGPSCKAAVALPRLRPDRESAQAGEGARLGRLCVLPVLLAGVLPGAGVGALPALLRAAASDAGGGPAWGLLYPQARRGPPPLRPPRALRMACRPPLGPWPAAWPPVKCVHARVLSTGMEPPPCGPQAVMSIRTDACAYYVQIRNAAGRRTASLVGKQEAARARPGMSCVALCCRERSLSLAEACPLSWEERTAACARREGSLRGRFCSLLQMRRVLACRDELAPDRRLAGECARRPGRTTLLTLDSVSALGAAARAGPGGRGALRGQLGGAGWAAAGAGLGAGGAAGARAAHLRRRARRRARAVPAAAAGARAPGAPPRPARPLGAPADSGLLWTSCPAGPHRPRQPGGGALCAHQSGDDGAARLPWRRAGLLSRRLVQLARLPRPRLLPLRAARS